MVAVGLALIVGLALAIDSSAKRVDYRQCMATTTDKTLCQSLKK